MDNFKIVRLLADLLVHMRFLEKLLDERLPREYVAHIKEESDEFYDRTIELFFELGAIDKKDI